MPYNYTLKTTLPGSPQDIYDAWMSSEGHTAMTGEIAHVDPKVGGKFDAADGILSGETFELEPGRFIKQSWRASGWKDSDADSVLEVTLEPDGESTLLTLKHSNVPDDRTEHEYEGWFVHYFEPMQRRFTWPKAVAEM